MIKLAGRICSAKMLERQSCRATHAPYQIIQIHILSASLSVYFPISVYDITVQHGLTCMWLYWEVWMTLADAVGKLCTVAKHFIICILGGHLSDIGAWKIRNLFKKLVHLQYKIEKSVIMHLLSWRLLWLSFFSGKQKGGNRKNVLENLFYDKVTECLNDSFMNRTVLVLKFNLLIQWSSFSS